MTDDQRRPSDSEISRELREYANILGPTKAGLSIYRAAARIEGLAKRADALHKALRELTDAAVGYGEAQFFDGDEMDEHAGDAMRIALENALTALATPSAPKGPQTTGEGAE